MQRWSLARLVNGDCGMNSAESGQADSQERRRSDLVYSLQGLGILVNGTAPGLAMSATDAACRAILFATP